MSPRFKVGDKVQVVQGDWRVQNGEVHEIETAEGSTDNPTVTLKDRGDNVFYSWRFTLYTPSLLKSTPADVGNVQRSVAGVALHAAMQKPANPKQMYGDKKPPVHLIHSIANLHESAALHSGALKYDRDNYIDSDVELMTYIGAIKRHADQYASGERVDRKELVHHLGAIKACCTILLTAEACGTLIDNRPNVTQQGYVKGPLVGPRISYADATAKAFAEVEHILEHLNKLYPPTA